MDVGNGNGGGSSNATFEALGVRLQVREAALALGWRRPTWIQRRAIAAAAGGRDVVAMARTGSGKTGAFMLAILERLAARHSTTIGVRALILAPTRELALQLSEVLRSLTKKCDVRHALLVGGASLDEQFEAIRCNPDILIGTPGRVAHVLRQTGLPLRQLVCIVLDEADRLLETREFAQDVDTIFERCPPSPQRQTLLFSATIPRSLAQLTKAQLSDPVVIREHASQRTSTRLINNFVAVRSHEEKVGALCLILQRLLDESKHVDNAKSDDLADENKAKHNKQVLVFVATKHHVEMIGRLVDAIGLSVAMVYGAMDATARRIAVGRFRASKCQVLVTTDVAARGIDLPLLDYVINVHFPDQPKLYVHRAGRVARAGRSGIAISLIAREDLPYALDAARFMHLALEPYTPDMIVEETKTKEDICALSRVQLIVPSVNDQVAVTSQQSSGDVESSGVDRQTIATLGGCPSRLLELEVERITKLLHNDSELETLRGVCDRAYKMYQSTRSGASHESVARAKSDDWALSFAGGDRAVNRALFSMSSSTNSLVSEDANADEDVRLNMLNALRGYKVKSTVFEIGGLDDVMHRKRVHHCLAIKGPRCLNSQPRQRLNPIIANDDHDDGAEQQTDRIEHRRAVEALVLDVNGDDPSSMRRVRQMKRWDARRKKYVSVGTMLDQAKDPGNEANLKQRRSNEAGHQVVDKKRRRDDKKDISNRNDNYRSAKRNKTAFHDWKRKSKQSLPLVGTRESDTLPMRGGRLGGNAVLRGRRGHHQSQQQNFNSSSRKHSSRSSAAAVDELKRPEQIRKQRKLEAKKKVEHQSRRQKRSKK